MEAVLRKNCEMSPQVITRPGRIGWFWECWSCDSRMWLRRIRCGNTSAWRP